MILLILCSFPCSDLCLLQPGTSLPRDQVRNPTSSNLILSDYRESSNLVFLVPPDYVENIIEKQGRGGRDLLLEDRRICTGSMDDVCKKKDDDGRKTEENERKKRQAPAQPNTPHLGSCRTTRSGLSTCHTTPARGRESP